MAKVLSMHLEVIALYSKTMKNFIKKDLHDPKGCDNIQLQHVQLSSVSAHLSTHTHLMHSGSDYKYFIAPPTFVLHVMGLQISRKRNNSTGEGGSGPV